MTESTIVVGIVPLQIGWGSCRTLTSVAELADCLISEWPAATDGDAYLTALMVCDAVLSSGEDDTPEHAREAFVEAAYEAGLSFFGEDDGPDF